MKKTMKYEIKRELSVEIIKDILTTAIEGGIGYWAVLCNDTPEWEAAREVCRQQMNDTPCYCDTAYELLSTGKSIRFVDNEADDYDNPKDDEVWYLTWNKFIQGCQGWEKWSGKALPRTVEDGDFDAEDADVLIQMALFNDIIFC